MKRIFCFLLLILFSCNNQNKVLKFVVDCDSIVSINGEVFDMNQIKEIVYKHRLKFNSEAEFKVEVCEKTKVNIVVELRKIIKSSAKNNHYLK
ncbi:hypothetical protein FDT66_03020 [Polaribacter aestuariivivens]|uniref:Uncharacterized protein n=1 Tax=Polaribacter aestuariivivens TaxID=2304626 RepID=A0A5S3NAZ2_9FLAO|nr:hypothetical protein [Polaribacter aestuariivivens]TMM32450.1 hypothetical protein FDT66_03020 [Polaribacter aestuariivivens]